jgi:F-box protein 11
LQEARIQTAETDLLLIATRLEKEFGALPFREAIAGRLRTPLKTRSDLLQALSDLPVNLFLTTNYDHVIEDCLRVQHRDVQVVRAPQDLPAIRSDRKTVVKLHGDIDSPASLVVTSLDYAEYESKQAEFVQFLQDQLIQRTILFVGVGLRDARLRRVDDAVLARFGSFRRPPYVLLISPEEESRQNRSDNVNKSVIEQDFCAYCEELEARRFRVIRVASYNDIPPFVRRVIAEVHRHEGVAPEKVDAEQCKTIAVQVSAKSQESAPKTVVTTHIVDALHRGNFTALTEAIKYAQPGDRVVVRPGLYREDIVIDKAIEIVGEGHLSDIVLEAADKTTVAFKANMGRIANLTIRQTGAGAGYGVDIAQGRVELDGCDISSMSRACVAIRGGAVPLLRRNCIHDGADGGVFIYESSFGTLEDNDIFGHRCAGVEIKDGSNPILRRNRIHDGRSTGVRVWKTGTGILEDNEVFGNVSAGVEILESGNPTLRRNRIYNGLSAGVCIHAGGQLIENDIFGNSSAGVRIREGGNPIVRRNHIHDGKANGILVMENSTGVLEENDIVGNAMAGIEVLIGCNPLVKRNRINGGGAAGVCIHGEATLERNQISGNAGVGIAISEGGTPVLRGNRICDGKAGGVCVGSGGGGLLEGNDIYGNVLAGVEIRDGGDPVVRGNHIHDGKQGGIFVHSNGVGTIEENDIDRDAMAGITVMSGGDPLVRRNRISENALEGIYVSEGGRGLFEDNDLRGNAQGPWNISADCLHSLRRVRNQE